jgi:enoyl-CoA hydratase/carnithine racemase
MTDMMLTGRVYQAEEGERIGMAQYLVEEGQGLKKEKNCSKNSLQRWNDQLCSYPCIPRIVDSGQSEGLLLESMMAAIAQSAPEAKQRLKDFLEGRAKKVGE